MDILKSLASLGGRTAANVARGAADIPQQLYSLARIPLNFATEKITGETMPERLPGVYGEPELTESVIKPIARATIGEEQLQSQGPLDEIIQRVAYGVAPSALIGGIAGGAKGAISALSPKAISSSLVGSAGMQAAQEADLPLPVQFVAGLTSEALFNKGLNKLNQRLKKGPQVQPGSLEDLAQSAKEKYYGEIEGSIGQKVKVAAADYAKDLKQLRKKILDDTSVQSGKSGLIESIDTYLKDLKNGSLTGAQAFKRRTQLNENIRNFHGKERQYYEAIREKLIPKIDQLKKVSPGFAKNLDAGDAILKAVKFPETFVSAAESYGKIGKALKNPLAYSVASAPFAYWMSGGDVLTSVGASVAGYTGAKIAGKGAEIAGFMADPVTQKILLNATKNVVMDKLPQAAKYYSQLNERADKFESKQNQRQKTLKDFEKTVKSKGDRPRREKRTRYL